MRSLTKAVKTKSVACLVAKAADCILRNFADCMKMSDLCEDKSIRLQPVNFDKTCKNIDKSKETNEKFLKVNDLLLTLPQSVQNSDEVKRIQTQLVRVSFDTVDSLIPMMQSLYSLARDLHGVVKKLMPKDVPKADSGNVPQGEGNVVPSDFATFSVRLNNEYFYFALQQFVRLRHGLFLSLNQTKILNSKFFKKMLSIAQIFETLVTHQSID